MKNPTQKIKKQELRQAAYDLYVAAQFYKENREEMKEYLRDYFSSDEDIVEFSTILTVDYSQPRESS